MGNTREVEIANTSLLIDEHENVTDPITGKESAGCWTWDCSLVLSYYLTSHIWPPSSFNQKTVIELGAGTGIPGLTASILGANVILTDLPTLLPGLQKNVEKNQLGNKVRVKELIWGDESSFSSLGLSQPVAFVLMSDLLYDVNSVAALCKTLRQISDGQTQILLAYELRYGTTECFKALKEGGFRWVKVPQKDLDPQWQSEDIGIFKVFKQETLQPLYSPGKCNNHEVEVVEAGTFEPSKHFYPRVLNAHINPLVRAFLTLGNERIGKRFCHLHPEADPAAVATVLNQSARFFQWGGADLFLTTTDHGQKRMVVVETNSCPSGQKSMPLANEEMEHAGYRTILEKSFMPHLLSNTYNGNPLPQGKLAVLYDKNKMEASGYAATLADLANEPVYLTPCYADDLNPKMRVTEDGVLEIYTTSAAIQNTNDNNNNNKNCCNNSTSYNSSNNNCNNGSAHNGFRPDKAWKPVRAAVRYVTQRPWTRIPAITRTLIFNPVLACLAGGRNKMLAAKAYDLYNAEIGSSGLRIYTPETMWDVAKPEIPLWVRRMGGLAVVKVPYANAGQGVWTITNESELTEFMDLEHRYDRFIVQALIGNNRWSSVSQQGRLYHVGTIPNLKGNIYAADLRLMIGSSPQGFFPVAIYARRARLPLAEKLDGGIRSWDMLGTNLSVKNPDGSWATETERLLLMDSRDFNSIGIGLDELIEAYMQTVLAVMAIDGLACKLITPKGCFGLKLFQSLNPDPKLLAEMYPTQLNPPLLPLEGAKIVSNNGSSKEGGKKLAGAQSLTEERLAAELEAQVGKAQSQSQKPLFE